MIKNKNKKILIVTVIVLLAAAVATVVVIKHSSDTSSNKTNGPRSANSVNYSGPTKQEAAAGNKQKAADVQRDQTNSRPAPSTASINIVDATQYGDTVEVRAYISNVYEDGGRCIATFTMGSSSVTQASTAFKDATTTQCGALDIPRSRFPNSGNWQLVLSYSSSTASGSTPIKTVTIN